LCYLDKRHSDRTYDRLAAPASTSAWQLARNKVHLRASARVRSKDRVTPSWLGANSFVAGSTW